MGRAPWSVVVRHVHVQGVADPQTVWRRYEDPGQWTRWAPHLTSVESSTPELRLGTSGVVTALRVFRARFFVTSVNPVARTWGWTVDTGACSLRLHHAVFPLPGGGTRACLAMRGPRLVVDGYLPLARWALRRLVRL